MTACTGRSIDVGVTEPKPCDQPAIVQIWTQGWEHYYPYCSIHRSMLIRIADQEDISIRFRKLRNDD